MFDKIRNGLYNKSDILFGLLIVCAVCAVIFWRVGIIMEYPTKLINGENQNNQLITSSNTQQGTKVADDIVDDSQPVEQENTPPPLDPSAGESAEVINHSVYIAAEDTPQTVATILLETGLITSEEQLVKAFENAGNPPLVSKEYSIPSNTKVEDIVKMITTP